MQVITLVSRKKSDALTDALFAEWTDREQHRASTLYMEGTLRQIWLRDDVAGACLLFEVDDADTARTLTESLPMMQQGMLQLDAVIPLKAYPGFAPR